MTESFQSWAHGHVSIYGITNIYLGSTHNIHTQLLEVREWTDCSDPIHTEPKRGQELKIMSKRDVIRRSLLGHDFSHVWQTTSQLSFWYGVWSHCLSVGGIIGELRPEETMAFKPCYHKHPYKAVN